MEAGMQGLSRIEIERMIDISVVQASNGYEDVKQLAEYAKNRKFCAVHALPTWVPTLREMMKGNHDTLVGSSVGFPSGGHSTHTKIFEAKQLIADGAQEMDVMMNVGRLKSGHYDFVENELKALVDVAGNMTLKVIIETGYLTTDEIKKACELCINAGADYVKTGSGWTTAVTTLEIVSLMVSFVGGSIKVKASGGIRDLATVRKMHQIGVSRFGINMQSSIKILRQAEQEGSGE
jgi:deoxyribose-phosphate aldolase